MRVIGLLLGIIVLAMSLGCGGRFAANQGRKQAARRSDHYIKKYAEPELTALYADDPDAQVKVKNISREGRDWLADVVVTSKGRKTHKRILVDNNGRVIEERR